MILTIAEGSTGSYYVDEDGRVYTERLFQIDPAGISGPRPGERPHPNRENAIGGHYQQMAYSTSFWLPTGHVEELGPEQRVALEAERERLDLHWLVVEAREFVLCPECGKPAPRDYRILVDGRVPFICENRHVSVDDGEPAEQSGKHVSVVRL